MELLVRRKTRKQLKTILHSAKTLRASREDVMEADDLAALNRRMEEARRAYRTKEIALMRSAGEELSECMKQLQPDKPFASLRENFDVMVVAISVAMAFRAYFYQPFKIPTGSMQPTLYGIHSEACAPDKATLLDKQPFKFARWLLTGRSLHIVRAKVDGTVRFMPADSSRKPGYMPLVVAGVPHYVPSDAMEMHNQQRTVRLKGGVANGTLVKKGDLLWSGVVISGDFVFVNRWLWNFRHPRRGEIMVFATNGITALQQGTHYIKRMTGLPNETLRIKPPSLIVNGRAVTEPERIAQITAKKPPRPGAEPYTGFNPSGARQLYLPGKSLADESDSVTLGADQYYAMGDNSFNSYDSRYWGPVPESNLMGPATMVYWPFTSPRRGRIR